MLIGSSVGSVGGIYQRCQPQRGGGVRQEGGRNAAVVSSLSHWSLRGYHAILDVLGGDRLGWKESQNKKSFLHYGHGASPCRETSIGTRSGLSYCTDCAE